MTFFFFFFLITETSHENFPCWILIIKYLHWSISLHCECQWTKTMTLEIWMSRTRNWDGYFVPSDQDPVVCFCLDFNISRFYIYEKKKNAAFDKWGALHPCALAILHAASASRQGARRKTLGINKTLIIWGALLLPAPCWHQRKKKKKSSSFLFWHQSLLTLHQTKCSPETSVSLQMNFSPAPPATLIIETTKSPPLCVAGPHSSDPADKTLKWRHLFKLSTEDGEARKKERRRRGRCVAPGCRQDSGMRGWMALELASPTGTLALMSRRRPVSTALGDRRRHPRD